jgi:hypothetical protein
VSRNRIGSLMGIGVLAVVVVLVSGPAATSETTPHVVTVDVVGDSLVTQASGELREHLAAAHLRATVVHRPRQDLGSDFVQSQLAAVRERPRSDVLVLATAANDALRDRDRTQAGGVEAAAATFSELLDRSIAPFSDRCVVLVNAREDTIEIYEPAHARALNALLQAARARHPNLVLVDWAVESRRVPPDRFAEDQLHFGADPNTATTGSGSAQAYADAIVSGIHRCVPAG